MKAGAANQRRKTHRRFWNGYENGSVRFEDDYPLEWSLQMIQSIGQTCFKDDQIE